MSEVRTNSITDAAGTGAPDFPNGITAASIPAANLTGSLPAINGSALTNLPAPTSAQVGSATAGLAYGAVGTYAFLWEAGQQVTPVGTQRAGSGLYYANAISDVNNTTWAGYFNVTASGTWMLMGYTGRANGLGTDYSYVAGSRTSVWLRVS
jgi:hypothetical protein